MRWPPSARVFLVFSLLLAGPARSLKTGDAAGLGPAMAVASGADSASAASSRWGPLRVAAQLLRQGPIGRAAGWRANGSATSEREGSTRGDVTPLFSDVRAAATTSRDGNVGSAIKGGGAGTTNITRQRSASAVTYKAPRRATQLASHHSDTYLGTDVDMEDGAGMITGGHGGSLPSRVHGSRSSSSEADRDRQRQQQKWWPRHLGHSSAFILNVSNAENCGGPREVKCTLFMRYFTWNYNLHFGSSIVVWCTVLLLMISFCACCCVTKR